MLRKPSIWSLLGLLTVCGGWLAGPETVRAEEKVRVTVVAILANDRDKTVDPKLECLAREIRKTEPRLTSFHLAQTACKSVSVGDSYQFPLVDNEVARVIVVHGADKDNRVSLKVKPPHLGEIVYTSACGKFFPIVTRYQTKDKDRLIIAVMVRPCKQ